MRDVALLSVDWRRKADRNGCGWRGKAGDNGGAIGGTRRYYASHRAGKFKLAPDAAQRMKGGGHDDSKTPHQDADQHRQHSTAQWPIAHRDLAYLAPHPPHSASRP